MNFKNLVIDAGARRVTRGGDEIALPKLWFDLLFALARAAPDSLSIDELMDQIWGKAVVNPGTVAKRVELLRQALGDDSTDPRPALPAPAASQPWIMAAVAAAAVVLGIASKSGSGRPAREKSVAVMSFVAVSEDDEIGIFADGLIEEVSHAFANIETLKVTGRTSGFF